MFAAPLAETTKTRSDMPTGYENIACGDYVRNNVNHTKQKEKEKEKQYKNSAKPMPIKYDTVTPMLCFIFSPHISKNLTSSPPHP